MPNSDLTHLTATTSAELRQAFGTGDIEMLPFYSGIDGASLEISLTREPLPVKMSKTDKQLQFRKNLDGLADGIKYLLDNGSNNMGSLAVIPTGETTGNPYLPEPLAQPRERWRNYHRSLARKAEGYLCILGNVRVGTLYLENKRTFVPTPPTNGGKEMLARSMAENMIRERFPTIKVIKEGY